MNLEAKKNLDLASVDPSYLILSALKDVFSGRSNVEIDFEFGFSYSSQVNVDTSRIRLVLANLIDNAVEAQNGKGKIFFKVTETSNQIKFGIANPGSFIEEDDLDRIFDRFYTHGKKGGTGLGLAIVKKIVEDHGGSVKCSSNQLEGTEFCFTVPRSAKKSTGMEKMPSSSSELCVFDTTSESDGNKITNLSGQSSFKILVIDDEELYRQDIVSQLHQVHGLPAQSNILNFSSPEFPLKQHLDASLILCDIDFQNSTSSGFDLVRKFRKMGFEGPIAFVSNRILRSNDPNLEGLKVARTLKKPVTDIDLVDLMKLAHEYEISMKPRIAVIEDDEIFVENWRSKMPEAEITHFENPNSFLSISKNIDGRGFDVIVTDLHFNNSKLTGDDVAGWVKKKWSHIPIVLSTGACDGDFENDLYTQICDKDGLTLAEIKR